MALQVFLKLEIAKVLGGTPYAIFWKSFREIDSLKEFLKYLFQKSLQKSVEKFLKKFLEYGETHLENLLMKSREKLLVKLLDESLKKV